jgi:Xaa-Pro aminopeptidase
MPLDPRGVQVELAEQRLDGWLLYDFHGSNPIAVRLADLQDSPKMTTRRWFYLIPRTGEPRALVHAIERHNLDHLPGSKIVYADRESLEAGLRTLLAGCGRVAMEYSPRGNIPYVSRVDAGTVELVRELGTDVASSGDLVQCFEARWDSYHLMMHRLASERLYRVKTRAFEEIGRRLEARTPTTEFDIQQLMLRWMADEGLKTSSPPVCAAAEHTSDPHYSPTPQRHRPIGRHEVVLLDLWGKMAQPQAVYADITWMGYTADRVPDEVTRAFAAAAAARDAAVALVQAAARDRTELCGFEVDRAARAELGARGYAPYVLHRTGHSLGQEVHGNGVHMDDYETHDDRRLLPGTGFTVEPGVYLPTFGIRTEINLYLSDHDVSVSGPMQDDVIPLLA